MLSEADAIAKLNKISEKAERQEPLKEGENYAQAAFLSNYLTYLEAVKQTALLIEIRDK